MGLSLKTEKNVGNKNNRILCMVLESDERIEDYTEEISYLTKLLSDTSSVEAFIKALPKALDKTIDLKEKPLFFTEN